MIEIYKEEYVPQNFNPKTIPDMFVMFIFCQRLSQARLLLPTEYVSSPLLSMFPINLQ